MQKSAKSMIFRIAAIILYGYLAGHAIVELAIHRNFEVFLHSEGALLRAELIMFIGLLRHSNGLITIALAVLSTGNLMLSLRYFRSLAGSGVNLMTVLLVLFYRLYAVVCAYILYVHLIHPENRMKSVALMITAHVLLLGVRFLYVSVFNSVIYGVLPVNLLPQHVMASRVLSGVLIGLRATLCDGLLAASED